MISSSSSQFVLQYNSLSLQQPVGYTINNDRVVINIAGVTNNRQFDNLSGTLSIELWALQQPFQWGHEFTGQCLAGTTIGELRGEHFIADCTYDLVFEQPKTGHWYLCIMLREWTGLAYETRDAVNFDIPYSVAWQPQVISSKTEKVVEVDFTKTEKKPANEVLPESTTVKATQAASDKQTPKGKVAKKPVEQDGLISINEAALEEVAKLKGVSKKVAKAIVDSRPFANLEELIQVKGLGKKLLDKVKGQIKL